MSTSKPASLSGLSGVDPRRVVLPNGAEVTLCEDVVHGDRTLPMGAVGRVMGMPSPDRVLVRLVGRGEVELPRALVAPRSDGHVRFAISRQLAQERLEPCAILRTTVGSRAWGLAHEGSDHDERGVFLWPFSWASARGRVADVVVSADGSHTLWEIGRTIEQALRADPNTLEMLWVSSYTAIDPLGERLRAERDAFVSREIYGAFGRYALAQSKKLSKSLRLARHRGMVLDWLDADAELDLDTVAGRLASEALEDETKQGHLRAKQYLKGLYRSMHDQGLLEACSFDALRQFARSRPADLELPRDLRPKNAYNLLRIVSCAVHWLRTGEPIIETSGELRDRLLEIKGGNVPLEQALAWTDAVADELEAARADSVLAEQPDFARADALLLQAREEAARRWIAAGPGPWGSDAPPVPTEQDAP